MFKFLSFALFVPDLSLIEGYGEERPEIPIGVTRFKKGNKILDFVTVKHTGKLQDATHRIINEAITTRSPQIVITEGHATDMDPFERKMIIKGTKEAVEAVQKNNNIQDEDTYIPEAGYAAYIASEQGIPSMGGEISGTDFITRMQARGYSLEDLLADIFMRRIEVIPLKDRKKMTDKEFVTKHSEELLTLANQRVNPSHNADIPELTLDQFRQWYALHPLSGGRRFVDVDHEDFVPKKQGSFFQKMACESGAVRDEHLAELFASFYNEDENNNTLLVEYGSDHLNSLRPLLVDMFDDEGTFTSLENEDTAPQQAA